MDAGHSLPSLGPRRRKQFSWEILAAAVLTLAAMSAIAAIGIFWITRQSDRVSVERQEHMARHAIMSSVDELALQQETVAIWDETATELAKPKPDPRWLHDNIGLWLHNIFGHDEVFILDGLDRPVQAAFKGRRVPVDRFLRLRPDLKHVLDGLRGRLAEANGPHDRIPGRPLASKNTVRTTPRSNHKSNLALIGGRPAAVSAMLIKTSTRGFVRRQGPNPVLVSVRYLERDFMADLQKKHLIENAHFSKVQESGPDVQSVAIETAQGQKMGYFSWRPRLPGSLLREELIPLAAAILFAFALLLLALARRLQTTAAELMDVEARATHLAFHDALTALPNRALLGARLEDALAAACSERPLWLALIDLDHFKQVNDTLGHLAGDQLIREFADRLAALVRPADTVARLGGDEFAILLADRWNEADVASVCEEILKSLARPFLLQGRKVFGGASIGVAGAGTLPLDAMELMRRADVALYRAKGDGRGCLRFYDPGMGLAGMQRAVLEAELREAIDAGQLETWYQPEVDPSGTTVGYEALLRWNHPAAAQGMEQVIAVAEESGLILQIGDIVLRAAAEAAARGNGRFVAVNLSAVQFRFDGFVDRILAIVGEAGASPSSIEFEVTERILLDDNPVVRRELARLRRAGFRIALDDFGTGYSSLGYLQKFRVDKIKIDRTFVSNVDRSAEARAIIAAIVALGHALNLTVTAEGVERREQVDILTVAGCDQLQGFYFAPARPRLAEEPPRPAERRAG